MGLFHLECPQLHLIGNGFCNDETNNADCNFDGGDCCGSCINTDYCTSCNCKEGFIGISPPNLFLGDGICNDKYNNKACDFDHGDCCLPDFKRDHCAECQCHVKGTCEAGYYPPSVGDGYCNDKTNIPECNNDGGDCCGPCINKDQCTECACHVQTSSVISPNAIVGDGYCNDETNTEECSYDGGDCCGNVKTDYCTECECYLTESCAAGSFPPEVGDGYCHDEFNTKACSYDGGDCCGNANTELCSECVCYLKESCAAGSPPSTVGDGICQDEYNIEECLFDGLDCCAWPDIISSPGGWGTIFDHEDAMTTTFPSTYEPTFHLDQSECTECVCHGRLI